MIRNEFLNLSLLCEYITILDSFLFVMKSMLVIENCWTDVIYSFDWYGLSPFTIHTGLSGEDLELRHTVFWCIYPSSRGDLFIRGTNYFFVIFFNDLVLSLLFYFFKSQTITSIYCIFRPYHVSLTKDNEICYNVINNFIRKKFIVITLFKSIQPLLQALQVILTCVFMELLKREMEDRKQRKSRTYRKGSDFFFPSVSEESLMWLKKDKLENL